MIKRLISPQILILFGAFFYFMVVYSPGLPIGTILIDDQQLTKAPQFIAPVSLDLIKTIFTVGTHYDYYPIRDLSYLIDNHLLGGQPFVFRLHQFFLYFLLLVLTLIFLVQCKVPPWPALFITMLWGFHPVHAEMLMWISARKDLLALFYGMCAALCFLQGVEKESKGFYVTSLLFFTLSLFSKASLTLIPLGALAICLSSSQDLKRKDTLVTLGLAFVIGLVFSLFQSWFYSHVNDMRLNYPYSERIMGSAIGYAKTVLGWFYFKLNVVDVENWGEWARLNHNYFLPGLLLWLLTGGLFIYSVVTKKKNLACALFCFALLYAPTSSLVFPHRNFYSVRYLEPAAFVLILGLGIIVGRRWSDFSKRTKIQLKVISFVIFGFYIWGNFNESQVWSDPISVFDKALKNQPENISLMAKELAEIRDFKAQKPPTPEILKKEAEFVKSLDQRCQKLELEKDNPGEMNCWLYYQLQMFYDVHHAKPEEAKEYLKLFATSSAKLDPLPHSVYTTLLSQSFREGRFDRDLIEKWEAINPYKPIVSYRITDWLATCGVKGPAAAKERLSYYVSKHLVDVPEIISFVTLDIPKIKDKVRPCFPDMPHVHF